jgi:hypothetical protein
MVYTLGKCHEIAQVGPFVVFFLPFLHFNDSINTLFFHHCF